MKFSLIAATLFFSLSIAHADSAAEAKKLSREASKIEREMSKLIPDIEARDPELKKLAEQSAQDSKAVNEALKTHPALADARKAQDEVFSQLTIAVGKGDPNAKQTAQEAHSKAQHELYRQGGEIPEIRALMDKAGQTGMAYLERKKAAYASQPETAELAKKAAELRDQASNLRRSAK